MLTDEEKNLLWIQLVPLVKGAYVPDTEIPEKVQITMPKRVLEYPEELLDAFKTHKIVTDAISHLPMQAITAHFPNSDDLLQRPLADFYHWLWAAWSEKKTPTILLFYPKNCPENETKKIPLEVIETTPLVFLDVDGVINGTREMDVKMVKVWVGNKNQCVKFSPSIIERINQWASVAEIRWLTTWKHQAKYHLAPALGLFDFEVSKDWKGEFANKLTETELSRPIVWIDDELNDELYLKKPLECLKKRITDSNKLLIVSPSEWVGLTHKEVDVVDDFLGLPR
uniref:Uncharacterized protein n=1 Tax=Marseillevirus LCMAC201 TaxID=2506605 RepID=A0A481YVB0_9VIRU|nr:MAG: hypothetical protein LCMAC201_00400 [Marseillevirus LCMAC201]